MLGLYVAKNKINISQLLTKFNFCIISIIYFISNYGLYVLGYHSMKIATALSGIFITLWISQKIQIIDNKISHFIITLGVLSMDIYILSDIIKIPFRIIFWNKLHLYYPSFIICSCMAIFLSYIFSVHVIRKNKLLSKLIFGIQ